MTRFVNGGGAHLPIHWLQVLFSYQVSRQTHFGRGDPKPFLTRLDLSFQPLVGVKLLIWIWVFTLLILPGVVGEMLGLFHHLALSRGVPGSGEATRLPRTTPFLEFRGSPRWAGSTDVSEDARRYLEQCFYLRTGQSSESPP